jgi:hypothetical protein
MARTPQQLVADTNRLAVHRPDRPARYAAARVLLQRDSADLAEMLDLELEVARLRAGWTRLAAAVVATPG